MTSKLLVASSELSRQQEALVFLDSISKTTNYNIVSKIKFHGKINKDKLFLSLHKVISINPQLGIRIYSENGIFFQEQHANFNKLIEKNMFSHKLKSTRDIEKIEFSYRFDLSKELPVRINFIENNEDTSFLIVTWHHIVSDEWSSKVFFKETQAFYQGDSSVSILENKKNIYFDYSLWQKTDSFNFLCKDAIKHFNTLISNDPIDLPFDYKKISNSVLLAKRVNLGFPKTFFLKIKKFCMQKNITPYLLFITIYQATLFRFTWQRNFNIGVPYANRDHSGAEDCIGLFSNSLPFPTDIKKGVSFSELLELNRKLSLLLMENQFLPFKCLVEEICKNREFGENPLFQVMFVYQNNQEIDFTLSGVHAEIIDPEPIYAKIPFCLFLKDCGDSFSVTLEFAKNLFENSTAKSFLFSFKGILESALDDTSEAIEDLNLIPKNKQALISIVSGLRKEYPKDRTIPQIIHDYATITPNAIAIEQADLYITYKQLNELSDVLAEKITKSGVLEGQVIGIACKRSAEHIIGLVAILKLNCTYSPIDIQQPETRNSYQINDANINCILVDKNYSNKLKTAFNQFLNSTNKCNSMPSGLG